MSYVSMLEYILYCLSVSNFGYMPLIYLKSPDFF